jgi:hypothetical protein
MTTQRPSQPSRRTTAVWALVAVAVTVAVALLGVSKAPGTPFDEAAHLDYVAKLSHGHMPKVYEQYGQDVLGELACDNPRGEAWAGLEPCGSKHYTPGLAPFGGLSTATNYAPTYYAITAVPYKVCDVTTSLHPRVCGRVANTLWLGAASAGFFLLMMMLGCTIVPALLVSIGTSLLPAVLVQGITVNPDAAVQAFVAWLAILAIWLATRSGVGHWRQILIMGIAGVFTVTAKETTLVGYAVIMLMLAFLLGHHRPRADQVRRWVAIAATVAAVVLLAALSRVLQPHLRGVGGENTLEAISKVPLDVLDDGAIGAVTTSMAPFTGLVWGPLAGPYLLSVSALATALAWGLALQIRLPRRVRPVGGSADAAEDAPSERPVTDDAPGAGAFPVLALVLTWVLPAVLVVLTWLSSRAVPYQQRYYMATATLLLVMGAATTTNPWLRWASAGVMALISAMVVQSLLVT